MPSVKLSFDNSIFLSVTGNVKRICLCLHGENYGDGWETWDTSEEKVSLVVGLVYEHLMPETTALQET